MVISYILKYTTRICFFHTKGQIQYCNIISLNYSLDVHDCSLWLHPLPPPPPTPPLPTNTHANPIRLFFLNGICIRITSLPQGQFACVLARDTRRLSLRLSGGVTTDDQGSRRRDTWNGTSDRCPSDQVTGVSHVVSDSSSMLY